MQRALLSMIGMVACCGIGLMATSAMAIDGPLANATISFGQWQGEFNPPLDRFTVPNPSGGVGNNDELIPNVVTIKAGGAVNFVISGLHNLQVFDDGTRPGDINTGITVPLAPVPVDLIDDSTNRIFRGADPRPVRDRVEVVRFATPGTYLVICGVLPHFVNNHMYGYVRVLPNK